MFEPRRRLSGRATVLGYQWVWDNERAVWTTSPNSQFHEATAGLVDGRWCLAFYPEEGEPLTLEVGVGCGPLKVRTLGLEPLGDDEARALVLAGWMLQGAFSLTSLTMIGVQNSRFEPRSFVRRK